jgi:hypothetical protein
MKWSIPTSVRLTAAFSVGVLLDLYAHSIIYDPENLKRAHLTSAAESYRLGCVEQTKDWSTCTKKMTKFMKELEDAVY